VLLNLSLTAQAEVISELTEVLRKQQADEKIGPLFEQASAAYAELMAGIRELLEKNE
jgi:hypothetical protein